MKKMLFKILILIKSVVRLIINKQIFWVFNLVETRNRYSMNALFSGVKFNNQEKDVVHNFRRNIHRIEKGLSYQKLKNTFATDYILETVNYLKILKDSTNPDANTITWGEAVLEKYFQTCEQTIEIEQANNIYKNLKLINSQPDWCPYTEKLRPPLSITYEAIYQLALRRRSIRYYIDKIVEVDLIEKAMKVAALSPSACNRQAFKFLFYNEKPIVNQIAQIPGGVSGYTVPSIIVVIGCYGGYFDERDINAPIIDSSLATMSFILALETLGLSSVCINWPNLPDRDQKIRKLIHLEKDEFVVMLIGVGYPDPEGKIPYSAKKEVQKLILSNNVLAETIGEIRTSQITS